MRTATRLAPSAASPATPHARVAVVMPAHDAAPFVRRALAGLLAQELTDWELVVVDDGSTDATAEIVAPFLRGRPGRLLRLDSNRGLGAALNAGISSTTAELIAYLPADDVVYPSHLRSLVEALEADPEAVLAHAGAAHHAQSQSIGAIEGFGLQLVQVLHRRTPDRWVEREELVTDDLGAMLWSKLAVRGRFVAREESRARGSTIQDSGTG